jgi:hypothetical protein
MVIVGAGTAFVSVLDELSGELRNVDESMIGCARIDKLLLYHLQLTG